MNTTANKRSIKDRIKHHTPEILVGASVIAGVVGFIYIRKSFDFGTVTAFASHAADPSVVLITGNEEAFVVMSAEALNTLEKSGKLDIGDKDAIRYVLSLVTDK